MMKSVLITALVTHLALQISFAQNTDSSSTSLTASTSASASVTASSSATASTSPSPDGESPSTGPETTPICPENQEYNSCSNGGCGKTNCSQLSQPDICIDPIECVGGCVCKRGYLRASNGSCILATECEGVCSDDQYIDSCPAISCVAHTCRDAGYPIACPFINPEFGCPGSPACVCKSGLLLDDNGKCIPEGECPSCGGDPYARPSSNSNNCGNRCSDYNSPNASYCDPTLYSYNLCVCIPGYVYDDKTGKCVLLEQCSPCGDNEVLNECPITLCEPKTCAEAGYDVVCPVISPGLPCPAEPACICRDGYLRNNNGICIPKNECPSCGGDENAVPGCGNCNPQCSNLNSTEQIFCIQICYVNGCNCKPGYYYDSNIKKCVLPEQCTPTCKANQVYSNCSNSCSLQFSQSCSSSGEPPSCTDVAPCIGGCICADGYKRADNGTCIPSDQCSNPQCGEHETINQCPILECKAKSCSQAGYPPLCITISPGLGCPGGPGCLCDDGYLRNDDGICIPKGECPSCGGDKNAYPGCGNCNKQCADRNSTEPIFCTEICYENGCNCRDGYYYDPNIQKCVLPDQCTPTCSANEVYSNCSNNCSLVSSQECSGESPSCTYAPCKGGCICADGYRRAQNGTCIPSEQCEPPICGPNETLNLCPILNCQPKTCDQAGFTPLCIRISPGIKCPGQPGCLCKDGYLRDKDNVCIPKENCPSCGGDSNAYPGCGNCNPLCSDIGNPDSTVCTDICYTNRCNCRKGYYYDSNTKKCVLPNQCTETCKVNEVYSNCSNSYCGPRTCADVGGPQICTSVSSCTTGCVCADGYVKADNGTCILPSQCPIPQCAEGEIYDSCPRVECDAEYCPLSENDPQSCPIPIVCGPGRCTCGFNSHRDRCTGKCIPTSSCPPFPCTGPHEVYNSCPPTCPGETCTDYIEKIGCPKFNILIVVPCAPQCKCETGYYRNSNNTCIPASECAGTSTTVPSNNGSSTPVNSEEAFNKLVASSQEFSTKFLYELIQENPESSVICSPISALVPIGELAPYTNGTAAAQLSALLGISSGDEVRLAFTTLFDTFQSQDNIDFTLSARVYGSASYPFTSQFLSDTQNIYQAAAETVDFNNPTEAANEINTWVANQTNDRITDLVSPDMLNSDTRLVLVSVIYFLGKWLFKFDIANTIDRDFYVNEDTTIQVKTMYQKGKFNYVDSPDIGAQLIELPYLNPNFTCTIILPHDIEGIDAVAQAIQNQTLLNNAIQGYSNVTVELYLPAINITTTINLQTILEADDVTEIFNPNNNEINGILENPSENLYVSTAIEKAFLKMDEDGSEAAAANAVVVSTRAVASQPLQDIIFRANHPYIILLKYLNTVIFLGAFKKP